MREYKNFECIQKQHISEFRGLENEITFSPYYEIENLPLRISRFGITYPNENYYIKREPSPCFIIEYIVSGYGYLEINEQKFKLCPGDVYIIHPGDFCTYYADKDEPYQKYWINFACGFFFTEVLNAYGINDRVIHGMNISGFFEELFKLEKLYVTNDELCIPISKLVFNLIMEIALFKKNNMPDNTENIASRVKFLLDNSTTSRITLDDIAKKCFRSKNDITRQFKKKYNTTPHDYLLGLRIGKAKHMLVNSKKTLAEIANHLCFSSEYHFSKIFKKKVGISPGEFRKKRS